MTKIKLFKSTDDIGHIESKINDWLIANENVDIIDIKIAMAGNGGTTIYTIYTVIYKEN